MAAPWDQSARAPMWRRGRAEDRAAELRGPPSAFGAGGRAALDAAEAKSAAMDRAEAERLLLR
jgi:hypothetical protein